MFDIQKIKAAIEQIAAEKKIGKKNSLRLSNMLSKRHTNETMQPKILM